VKRFVVSALLCFVGLAGSARADVCNLDVNPAATLLLPYFEVDLANPAGVNTLFTVNNSGPAAVLTNVTVWSDLSVPIFNFNVYLTGYDMEMLDLRDIIVNGNLPQTASSGQDPLDVISHKGTLSQDINFSSCAGLLPPAPLSTSFLDHIQDSLSGLPSALLGGQCAGRNISDSIARGYITVDAVTACGIGVPSDPGYFDDAWDANVLFGDFAITNPGKRNGAGLPLVHIEASATNPETSTAGQYTFYGRYVGWTGADHREPLATLFGARYVTGDSDMIVWRDSKNVQGPFNCPARNGRPAWFQLGQAGIVVFDEQENVTVLTGAPFPAEAQRTAIGGSRFPVPFNAGWAFLDLSVLSPVSGAGPYPADPKLFQAWVGVIVHGDLGRIATGFDALRFDSACKEVHQDVTRYFYDNLP
jgi:hypothetical protein